MKKLILICLVIGIILSVPFSVTAESKPVWSTVGDGDRDGKVNAHDALMALTMGVLKMPGPYYIVGFGVPADQLSEDQLAYYYDATHIALDVNNDDRVGAEDALMILQYAVDKRDGFPKTDLSSIADLTWPVAQ